MIDEFQKYKTDRESRILRRVVRGALVYLVGILLAGAFSVAGIFNPVFAPVSKTLLLVLSVSCVGFCIWAIWHWGRLNRSIMSLWIGVLAINVFVAAANYFDLWAKIARAWGRH